MNNTTARVIVSLSEILDQLTDDLNKLNTLSIRSKNSQQRLLQMFTEVSEVVQNIDFGDEDVDKIVEQYLGIAKEHEFSAETFQEISETILTFLSYTNVMYGYIMAGKDMIEYEGFNKRSKRQCRKRVGRTFQRERDGLRHRFKQGRIVG